MKIVLDTNVIISALIKNGYSRDILINSYYEFLTPAYTLSEINKYKKEICYKSGITEEQFSMLLRLLFKNIQIANPIEYSKNMDLAKNIIGNIDIKDVPFIACALTFSAPIWSDDNHFKKQNKVNILTTEDMNREL